MSIKSNRTKIQHLLDKSRRTFDPTLVELVNLISDDLHNIITTISPFITADGVIFNNLFNDPPGVERQSKLWVIQSGLRTAFYYKIGTNKPKYAFPGAVCTVTRTVPFAVPNNVQTLVPWDAEVFDLENLHDVAVNNTRVVIRVAGNYVVSFSVEFAPNAVNDRGVYIAVNGVNVGGPISYQPASALGPAALSGSLVLPLLMGDYVELLAFQDSGGALNIAASSRLSVIWHS